MRYRDFYRYYKPKHGKINPKAHPVDSLPFIHYQTLKGEIDTVLYKRENYKAFGLHRCFFVVVFFFQYRSVCVGAAFFSLMQLSVHLNYSLHQTFQDYDHLSLAFCFIVVSCTTIE